MKTKILDALKSKFAGVKADILDRVAQRLSETVTSEDDIATAVDGALTIILETYGDKRATDAQKTAVANYERKHGLKDGKKVDGENTDGKPTHNDEGEGEDDIRAALKKLLAQNEQLNARLDKMDGERTHNRRRTELAEITKSLPTALRKAYDRITLDTLTDEEFDTLKTEVTAEVEEIGKQDGVRSAVFGRPKSSVQSTVTSTKEATDAEADAVVKKLI